MEDQLKECVAPRTWGWGLAAAAAFALVAPHCRNTCGETFGSLDDAANTVAQPTIGVGQPSTAVTSASRFVTLSSGESQRSQDVHAPKLYTAPGSDLGDQAVGQSVIDVMVLYTGLAKSAYGEGGVRDRVTIAIAYMNEALNRSGVNARMRLVHCAETTWHDESPQASDELSWLRGDDRVEELQNEFGADLITLFVRDGRPAGGLCSIGSPYSVGSGSAYTFAHEWGHSLGCHHDRPNAWYNASKSTEYRFGCQG